jgi:hypothetical protein
MFDDNALRTPLSQGAAMTRNVGSADRVIRTLVALAIGVLIMGGQLTGTAAVILGIVAVVLLVTGATGVCPLYALLKLTTAKRSA